MKKNIKVKLLSLLGLLSLVGWIGLGMVATQGCDSDDDCLVRDENCSQAYIEANYGGSASCCSGLTCRQEYSTHGSYLICRSY